MSNDLQSKIAALPEWPDTVGVHGSLGAIICLERDAALARLALAREWIEDAHRLWCDLVPDEEGRRAGPCDCGRDALLLALEVPR